MFGCYSVLCFNHLASTHFSYYTACRILIHSSHSVSNQISFYFFSFVNQVLHKIVSWFHCPRQEQVVRELFHSAFSRGILVRLPYGAKLLLWYVPIFSARCLSAPTFCILVAWLAQPSCYFLWSHCLPI